jgi:hypothetical protein
MWGSSSAGRAAQARPLRRPPRVTITANADEASELSLPHRMEPATLLESKVHKIDPDDRVFGAAEVPVLTRSGARRRVPFRAAWRKSTSQAQNRLVPKRTLDSARDGFLRGSVPTHTSAGAA